MKDSCSTGATVWELDGKTITKHDLSAEPPIIQKMTFESEIIALSWYADIALPISMGTPERKDDPFEI